MTGAVLAVGLASLAAADAQAAQGWKRPGTLAHGSLDEPAASANARGRAAVAWKSRRGIEVRIADGRRAFGRRLRIPGSRTEATPANVHTAVAPSGQVVVAWQDYREGDSPTGEGECCAYWRLAIGGSGGFRPARDLSSQQGLTSRMLRIAFDEKSRPWVAWEEDLRQTGPRRYVARLSVTGRRVDRRTVPEPGGELLALRIHRGVPEVLMVGASLFNRTPLLRARVSRRPSRPRTLFFSRSLNVTPALGLDRRGDPRLMVWGDNREAVKASARRGGRLRPTTVLVRRRVGTLFGYTVATNRTGAGMAGVVSAYDDRARLDVFFAARSSQLRGPRRASGARPALRTPATLLDDTGRGDLAWRTPAGTLVLNSYRNARPIGRIVVSGRRLEDRFCDFIDECPAAVGTTVGRRGALIVWRDGTRIRAIRR